MLESTDESELPPSIPPPQPLSPMFIDTFSWEPYEPPQGGGIGLKRRRNSRARSPPEAPPHKGPRIGSALPTVSSSLGDTRGGGDAVGGGNSTEDGNAVEGDHHRDTRPSSAESGVGFGVQIPPSTNVADGTTIHVSICLAYASRGLIMF